MEMLKNYFNKIKAEEEIKEKTKDYMIKTFSQDDEKKKNTTNFHGFKRRAMLSAACAVFAVCAISLGGYFFYKTPVNYVSLDINPSVEIALNSLDRVVSVESMNDDGKEIVEGIKIENMKAEQAIDSLVQKAADEGFVEENGSSVIAVTVESDSEEKAIELEEKSSNGVSSAMKAKNFYAAIYSDCSDLEFRNEARDFGVSPGKYKLIKLLQSLDETIDIEDYKDAKVKDIIQKAAQLAQDNPSLDDEVAQRVMERVENAQNQAAQNKEKAAQRVRERVNDEQDNEDCDQAQSREQERDQSNNSNGLANRSQGEDATQQNGDENRSQNSDDKKENAPKI